MIRELDGADLGALAAFFARLPDGDVTFIKEDLDAASLRRWVEPGRPGRRWVEVDSGEVAGFAAILPLSGWSSHVGELRLVVAADHRGTGLGRRLAQHSLRQAVLMGLRKVTVEVVAGQAATISMLVKLGFAAEAMLEDHIVDRHGEFQDLVVLAHRVDDAWSAMAVAGVDDALAG